MKLSEKPPHQQRHRYRLTAEEADVLLWYRTLPYLARRCLCSFVLRLTVGMGAEDAAQLYHLKTAAGRGGRLPPMQGQGGGA